MKQDYFEPGVVYHVFNRGNNQENIFIEDRNYLYFLTLLKKYLLPVADIYAYCLLKNKIFTYRTRSLSVYSASCMYLP